MNNDTILHIYMYNLQQLKEMTTQRRRIVHFTNKMILLLKYIYQM